MDVLNYQRLMALKPTVYTTFINSVGQSIELVEHPSKGEEYPVIIVYHAEKLAVCSHFWDTKDMTSNSDYEPIYKHGQINMAFELSY